MSHDGPRRLASKSAELHRNEHKSQVECKIIIWCVLSFSGNDSSWTKRQECLCCLCWVYGMCVKVMFMLCPRSVHVMFMFCYVMFMLCVCYVYVMSLLCLSYVYVMFMVCLWYVYVIDVYGMFMVCSCTGFWSGIVVFIWTVKLPLGIFELFRKRQLLNNIAPILCTMTSKWATMVHALASKSAKLHRNEHKSQVECKIVIWYVLSFSGNDNSWTKRQEWLRYVYVMFMLCVCYVYVLCPCHAYAMFMYWLFVQELSCLFGL